MDLTTILRLAKLGGTHVAEVEAQCHRQRLYLRDPLPMPANPRQEKGIMAVSPRREPGLALL